jgi:thiamine transport system substrate-binding protein
MTLKRKILFGLALGASLLIQACGAQGTNLPPADTVESEAAQSETSEARTLTVMTHDSFAVSEEVLSIFEAAHNAEVTILLSGDTGTAVNKAALTKDAPLADVFYGVDNTFLSRALAEDIFEAYDSPLLSDIPDDFELDPIHRALPVDYGDVCLNYHRSYFEENNLPVPETLADLLDPAYKGLVTVQNPATSSPGLAFLFATIGAFGEDNYLEFWEGMVENEVAVVNDWEVAYYTEFSQWGGPDPLVVSYGSSPPFEMIFAETPLDEPPTGAVIGPNACFRQIEFVGILKGTENRELAEAWVDFMLSPTFQEDIPLQMFVFPVNPNAVLDPAFVEYLAVPENPVILDPALIAANREAWIEAWMSTVIR